MQEYRSDITACDDCGLCCKTPCLLGSYSDVERLAEIRGLSVKESLQDLRMEHTPSDEWLVRIKPVDGKCPYHIGNRCTVHGAKPTGGAEFKCWDKTTFTKTYHWSKSDLNKLVHANVEAA